MPNKWKMTVTPARAFDKAGNDLDKIQRVLINPRTLIEFAGPIAVRAMSGRTLKGSDSNDRPMRPYSPKYADQRKGGRRAPRTLKDEGIMLDAMTFRVVTNTRGEVFFQARGNPSRDAVASAHHDDVNFFGMSPSDMRLMNKETDAMMEKVIRRQLAGSEFEVKGTKAFTVRGGKAWTGGKADRG